MAKILEEKSNLIKEMYYKGYTQIEIANLLHISNSTISDALRNPSGLSVFQQRKKAMEDKVLVLKNEGRTLKEIANICEITEQQARYIVQKTKGRAVFTKSAYPEIEKFLNRENLTKTALADYCDVKYQQVDTILMGYYPVKEGTRLNRRCTAINRIIDGVLELSGMSFQQAFGNKNFVGMFSDDNDSYKVRSCYAAVDAWMKGNHVTVRGLATESSVCYKTAERLLKGKIKLDTNPEIGRYSYRQTQRVIDTILQFSNMSYEQAFAEIFEKDENIDGTTVDLTTNT